MASRDVPNLMTQQPRGAERFKLVNCSLCVFACNVYMKGGVGKPESELRLIVWVRVGA